MTRSNESGAELFAKVTGALIIYVGLTLLIDVFLSWMVGMACNADFHTHYGTFSLFWANIWLSLNVAATIRSVIKKSYQR